MAVTIFFGFLILWVAGIITVYTVGGLIHLLLLVALVLLLLDYV